jgi:hypothetical protein
MDRDTTTERADLSAGTDRPIRQLEKIIDDLATYATPVVREIAARAAELAAKAGQAAGPMAQRAADKTEAVGGRFADKSREFATDLRRETSVAEPGPALPAAPDPRPSTSDSV